MGELQIAPGLGRRLQIAGPWEEKEVSSSLSDLRLCVEKGSKIPHQSTFPLDNLLAVRFAD
jgi:hypothetical protein